MFKTSAVAKALTLVVATSVPFVAIAGPLAGVAEAAPKPRAAAPVFTTKPANPSNVKTPTFGWAVPSGYSYQCAHDGSKLAACTPPVTLSSLADGSHTFTVKSSVTGARSSTTNFSWRIDTVPPAAPSITAPPSPTRATSASIAFSDSDRSVASYTCTLDPGTAGAQVTAHCASPFTVTNLSEATHVVSVAALDAAGNSASASTSWTVDTTAPDVPVIVGPASPSNNTASSLSFSTVDSASFTCNLDGTDLGACTSPKALSGLTDGTHVFTVTAHDLAGNTTPNSVTWTVDTTPPPAPSLVGGPADPTDDTSPSVTFSDFDPSGVAFTCTVTDLTTAAVVQGPQPCASPYDVTAATTDGDRYQLGVAVVDGAGNPGPSLTTAWTVSLGLTPAPAAFVSTPASPSNNNTPTFSFVATDLGTTGGTTGFLCSVDGAAASACGTPDPTTPTTYTFASALTDGAHAFAVQATNGTATSSPITWNWTVDTTPPPAPVVVAPDPSTTVNPTITFTDTDTTVTFSCSIDGALPATACVSPWTQPSGLSDGSHTLTVTATDPAGNATPAAPVTFTVRNAPVTSPGGGTGPTPPSVSSVTVPTTLVAPAVVHFSTTVTGLTAGAVKLAVSGTTAAIATTIACLNGTTPVACSASYTAVRLTPRAALVPGQHYTVSVAAGATHDLTGTASTAGSAAFRAARSVQESDAPVHATWTSVRTTAALGGSYVTEHLAGASAAWTFAGTSVVWWTVTGPAQGKAAVYVDGVRKAIFSNYAAATHYRVGRLVKGLTSARHTVKVVVLGVKGATAGTGTFVAIDGFTVGRTLTASPSLVTTWRSVPSSHFSGGRAIVADRPGEAITVVFRGTGISWITMRGTTQGIAKVYLDGVLKATFDDYSTTTSYGVARSLSRLVDKVHTLRIVVTGTHHRGATGSLVTVDRFAIA